MNTKQIQRATTRNDRKYRVYADFCDKDCMFSAGHLLMGQRASFRRIKKAAKAIMATGKFVSVNFRDGGQLITPKNTKEKVHVLKNMSEQELKLNPNWPNMVRFHIKMNKCAERINAQYA